MSSQDSGSSFYDNFKKIEDEEYEPITDMELFYLHQCYLDTIKQKIDAEFRPQKAKKLYEATEYCYFQCCKYIRGATIGSSDLENSIKVSDHTARNYLKWLRDMGYLIIKEESKVTIKNGKKIGSGLARKYKWTKVKLTAYSINSSEQDHLLSEYHQNSIDSFHENNDLTDNSKKSL